MAALSKTAGAVGAAVALLLNGSGCSSSGTHQAAPNGSSTTQAPTGASSPSTITALSACTLPLTQDPYDGFHIGVPNGWELFTLHGTIVVSKDPSATEEATVTPVLLTQGLSPATIFSSALASLRGEIGGAGGKMTDDITNTGDEAPAATLSLSEGQVSMAGAARLVVVREPTAHGSAIAALLAGWAPTASFPAQSATLAAIGSCYGPQPGTLYQVRSDQAFTYAIPVGWTIDSEGQDNIEIAKGNQASASYVLTLLPSGTGVDSPQTLLAYAFRKLGVQVGRVLASQQLPNQPVSNGVTEGQEYEEFTGSLAGGQAIHGLVYVLSDTGTSTPSGVIRMGLAATNEWNSVNGALTHIVNSIQHNFTQDLQQWENINQQEQTFSQQVQGFDYALNGVDLVHDSTTGATYEAPYDTYDASGPDGPGYYDQAGNKLQVETP